MARLVRHGFFSFIRSITVTKRRNTQQAAVFTTDRSSILTVTPNVANLPLSLYG